MEYQPVSEPVFESDLRNKGLWFFFVVNILLILSINLIITPVHV